MGKGAAGARRLAAQALVVLGLVALAFLMHAIGREFDVMIDNHAVDIGGSRHDAIAYGSVSIDGDAKGFDVWADDRVIKKMVGASHKLTIKILNEDDDSVIRTIERDIKIDFDTRAEMVSIAAIASGAPDILTPNPRYSPARPVFTDDNPEPAGSDGLEGDGIPGEIMGEGP
ncbi:MAG: hypothetical protein LBQ36_01615 [Synergistaceae bacterium]|jgi:hypothetical protein|nr:hypothetical protein [Synergistaceae bacterium]